MSGDLGLNDIAQMPFDDKLQDLFFVYGDGVIDRAVRCIEAEVNDWVNHSWYAAYHWSLPMEPEMKRKLLKDMYELGYEPCHEVGAPVFIRDQANYWPEDCIQIRSFDMWSA